MSVNCIEWQCNTWGSGREQGDWEETALFVLVAELFDLGTGRNWDDRDQAIVWVPLERLADIRRLIERLGIEAEQWPWFEEEDEDRQLAVASEVLGIPPATLADDHELLEVLRIE